MFIKLERSFYVHKSVQNTLFGKKESPYGISIVAVTFNPARIIS
ncbi:MAG: hypothetical protein JWQ85_603 [Mucilaginibacter sp.]|jgi:hypothetical protein|nr:hypothetical protein [Mucilaginibacter sp.]